MLKGALAGAVSAAEVLIRGSKPHEVVMIFNGIMWSSSRTRPMEDGPAMAINEGALVHMMTQSYVQRFFIRSLVGTKILLRSGALGLRSLVLIWT